MQFFGTDGIRGLYNVPPLTPEHIARIGQGISSYLGPKAHLVVGHDTRASCLPILEALLEGLSDVSVTLLGTAPTPAVAFVTRALSADMGIMISASHNPHIYNGLKFFTGAGEKLSRLQETQLEQCIVAGIHHKGISPVLKKGSLSMYVDAVHHLAPDLQGIRVVLDCAHGAFSGIAEAVFRGCGAQVVGTLGSSPTGNNINEACGSIHPNSLQEAVVQTGADLGIAFDGDGDRVLLVDERGHMHDGDQLLAGLSLGTKGGVVGTVVSNLGLEQFCKEQGTPFCRTAVGDRFVAEEMKNRGWHWGGETCGHLVVGKHLMTGDGLAAALLGADLLVANEAKCSDVFPLFQALPTMLYNVAVRSCAAALLQEPSIVEHQDRILEALSGKGRLLVRASGTEPLIRIVLEGHAMEDMHPMIEALLSQLRKQDALLETKKAP